MLNGVNEPGRFADLVAGYIDIGYQQRQALLETLSVEGGSAGSWCTSSGRSRCSKPRRTSSPRSRKSWASGSGRCSSASR